MLNCRKIISETDALLEGELSWHRRASLKTHLLICRHCRRYVRQFRWLLRAIPGMHGRATDDEVQQVMALVQQHGGRG